MSLDPKAAGTAGLPIVGMVNAGGAAYLTLTYSRAIAATDIAYVPQVSGDLATWSSGSQAVVTVSTTDNPDGTTQNVTVRDLTPKTNARARFIRLVVTHP